MAVPHSKRAAYVPATCTAAAHVRSARSLSYAAEPRPPSGATIGQACSALQRSPQARDR